MRKLGLQEGGLQLDPSRTVVQHKRAVRTHRPAGHRVQDVILCMLIEWNCFLLRKGNGFGDGTLMHRCEYSRLIVFLSGSAKKRYMETEC